MAIITLLNQKDYQAQAIFEKASEISKMAIQGKGRCRYISGNNFTVTSRPIEKYDGVSQDPYLDYEDCTIEIRSGIFQEITLLEMFEL